MTTTKIFSGQVDSTILNVSSDFYKGNYLYMVAPDTADEIEIDCYLNIKFTSPEGYRLVPLGKYELTTRDLLLIPSEFTGTPDTPFQVVLLPSFSVFLEVYVVDNGCCNDKQLNEIQSRIELIDGKLNLIGLNQIAQDSAVSLLTIGVGTALAPLTGGASLALPGVVGTALAPGLSALAPIALLAGVI